LLAEEAKKVEDKKISEVTNYVTTYTKGPDLGDAAGSVGSTGDLGGATDAGYSTPSNVASASSYDDGPGDSSPSGDSGMDSSSDSFDGGGGGWTAKGGFIGKNKNFALGGKGEAEPAGFIGGPPEQFDDQTTIADDIPLKVKDGTFVLNAPAVENEGSSSVQKMLAEGYEKAMTRDIGVDKNFKIGKIPSIGELDIQISRGEVVVPPHVAKVIGYDRLEKINNRGKREVERRQKAGNQEKVQAGQGFAATGGEQFGVDVQPITREQGTFTSFKNFLKKSKPLRSDIEQFIDTIPGDKSRLGILAGVEAPLASSTLPELEAIIQTILNRVDDTTYEYRNINTIKDIMKQRSSRGTGSKMFMYDGLERKHITPRLKEIVQNPKVFQAGLDAAENVLTKGGGEPDYETSMLPKDVFQYSLEGKPSAVNNNNPKLKFYKKIGKHNFYKRIPQ
jgi:hypothetical protein